MSINLWQEAARVPSSRPIKACDRGSLTHILVVQFSEVEHSYVCVVVASENSTATGRVAGDSQCHVSPKTCGEDLFTIRLEKA